MNQPTLFEPAPILAPLVSPPDPRRGTLEERWARFHEANPHVYRALREQALSVKALGAKQWSINAAFERLRWLWLVQTKGDLYKLNNSFRACYARELMAREPRLAGFFATRESPHDPEYYGRDGGR